MRILLLLAALLSCHPPLGPWQVHESERIPQPPAAETLWREVLRCLDQPWRPLSVRWFLADQISTQDGGQAVGLWEKPDRIYLVSRANFILRHELVHHARQNGRHDEVTKRCS